MFLVSFKYMKRRILSGIVEVILMSRKQKSDGAVLEEMAENKTIPTSASVEDFIR